MSADQPIFVQEAPKLQLERALNYKAPEVSRSSNYEADEVISIILANTAFQVSQDSTQRDQIALIADAGNTGKIYVGSQRPTFLLSSSQYLYVTKSKLSMLFYSGTTAGDKFYYIAGGRV